jgi:diphthine synthase
MIRNEIINIRKYEPPLIESNKPMQEILDNAEYYIDDAINFMSQGKNELAILSIGYADGLVNSLNSMIRKKEGYR